MRTRGEAVTHHFLLCLFDHHIGLFLVIDWLHEDAGDSLRVGHPYSSLFVGLNGKNFSAIARNVPIADHPHRPISCVLLLHALPHDAGSTRIVSILHDRPFTAILL